ncbi:heterokaryon incompatibility protein-domain-containing protein [Pisolithus albus]|nr:heterokaryon incompatibility protein-domain-containing protein [Pisolithus albus]
MRLIDVGAFLEREIQMKQGGTVDHDMKSVLEERSDASKDYAILSHRWLDGDEVNFLEIMELAKMENRDKIRKRSGYQKIVKSCQQAEADELKWLWVDTCCIDKRSSSELSETLNSMFRWYENSNKCYAYLHDVDVFPTTPNNETSAGSGCGPEWFSRGWTLQELIAPMDLQFFNKDWQAIGNKRDLATTLEKITRVPFGVLVDGLASYHPSVAQVMSWAADRRTTRIEDRAYSLMGLLNVNMPMLYGEGKKAFIRLQQEIIRNSSDQSIFAWKPTNETLQTCGILADDPNLFRDCHDIIQIPSGEFYSKLSDLRGVRVTSEVDKLLRSMDYFPWLSYFFRSWTTEMPALHASIVTNLGIQMQLPVLRYPGCPIVLQVVLACRKEGSSGLITIDIAPWRSRCYRYTGQFLSYLLPDTYQHSQFILSHEVIGAPSGIVIEDAVGVAASLLDKCATKTGTKVTGGNEHCFGVTCADVGDILNQPLSILLDVIPYIRRLLAQRLPYVCVFFALGAPATFFLAATEAILLFVVLKFDIAFTRTPLADHSIPGEYIIGSGTEIVLLRGEGRAVASIIHSEICSVYRALQVFPQLSGIVCAICLSYRSYLRSLCSHAYSSGYHLW